MSLPEISRRCLSCGAAVRAGARFCPHCGKAVGDAGTSRTDDADARRAAFRAEGSNDGGTAPARSDTQERAEAVAPETKDAPAPREWATPKKEFSEFVQSLEGSNAAAEAKPSTEAGASADADSDADA